MLIIMLQFQILLNLVIILYAKNNEVILIVCQMRIYPLQEIHRYVDIIIKIIY